MGLRVLSDLIIGNLRFPSSDGNNGQVLRTDGAGNLHFATVSTSDTKLNALSFNTGSGVLTATLSDNNTVTVDLDGRYAAASHVHAYDNYQFWNLKTNGIQRTTVQSGGTLDLVAGSNVALSYGAGGIVTISSTDTNTVYTHPSYTARSIDTTGAQVLDVFTSDANGHVTNITKRTMTLADLGYTGATNANNITNNNQLVNGAGYITADASITGNAATATTLQTARSINGTSFNGSAAITTANWGTARTITIGSTGKSVNGSANVSWSLAEIGAAAASHNHTSLTGVTSIEFAAEASDRGSITTTVSGTSTFFDFNLTDDNNNDEWRWRFTPSGGVVYNALRLVPATNTTANLIVSGTISASNFSGSSSGTNTGDQTTISGNAGSATVLQTARTLTIGSTGKTFNGSANVSWTLAEIGAQAAGSYAAASHTHDDRYYTETEVSNFFSGTTAITGYNKSNWDTAFGWGNHAGQGYATQTYVNTAVSNLVDTAPDTLNTLNELAAALGDDPNFATTVATSIGSKLDASVNPIKNATVSNDTITFTRADNTTFTVTTSDANTVTSIRANNTGTYRTGNVNLVAGSNVTISETSAGIFNISSTDTNTTYSVRDGELSEINFTRALAEKLDGIEAGATGDQTAAEILTLIKTVDGAGSGLDADVLDGLSSGSFLRSDTANGNFRLTSGNGNGLRFWDSDAYKIWMSATTDATWGGRLDSTSDYNMYFRMTGGTNRGFVFKNDTTNIAQIDSTGTIYTASHGNSSEWKNAYDNYITGISVSGTSTKTITLTQRDGGTITTTFTDIDTDTNTWRPIDDTPRDGQTGVSISSNWAFDNVKTAVPANARFTDTTYSVGDGGLTEKNFTSALKTKLDGIAASANNYVHPTTAGNKHIPAGGSAGQFLKYSADGTAVWAADNNTTYSVGDGGLTEKNFTSALKTKLDGIAASANNYSHPGYTARSIDTSGAAVLDILTVDTSGHVTAASTRNLTLADLGYTGATNANYITNNNQLTNGAGYVTASHNHGIGNITDSTRWWNNFGDNHSARTAFDATTPSYGFGWRFVQGGTNGPNVNGATQYYSLYTGLGNDYPATGEGSYGMQLAIPRDVTTPYLSIRYNEANRLNAWQKISAGYADSAGSVAWDNVSGKPSTFSPSSHTHSIANVTGLQAALDGKQASGSYAAASHTHTIANVTGLQAAIDGKAASSHTHTIANVTGLQTALDGKAASSHTHTIANVTGLQTALDGKQASGSYAAASHTHTIANVTGLQAALDGKQAAGSYAAASHTHTIANVTGLQTALDGKQAAGSYAAAAHDHDRSFITDSRGAQRAPSFYDDRYAQWDFQNADDTRAEGDAWHSLLTVSKWASFDASHRQEQIIFTGDNLKRRTAASDTTWGPVKTIYDSGNLTLATLGYTGATNANYITNNNQLTNGASYITSGGRAYPRRVGGGDLNFNWSGQSGQPTWLWGGTDGTNMYVYNPSNFSVNYAASAGSVAWGNVSGRPTAVSSFTNDSGYVTGGSSPTFSDLYVNNWFRNNEANEGLYNTATTQHWSSRENGYWDASSTTSVSSIRFYTGGHVRDLRGYVYANTSNEIGFLNSSGSWSLRCDNSGNVTATGDVTAYSDARIKTEVKTVENALNKVLALRGVTYKRTDTEDKSTKLGVIAQEVKEILPEVVSENQDGMLTVSYGNMVGVLIEAMKEQQQVIETLEAKIELLTKYLK